MYSVPGTWTNPITKKPLPDLSLTEYLLRGLGGSTFNNPAAGPGVPTPANAVRPAEKISPGFIGAPAPFNINRDVLGLTTDNAYDRSSGNGSFSAPTTNNSNLFDGILDTAKMARENALRSADDFLSGARSFFDQGMETLGKKRGQFKEMFDNTSGDILSGYEKNRGELQASAAGARTRSQNALRALGLGGSANVNLQGRQNQQNAKALGGLQEERTKSDRANKANFDEQNTWADSQENTLSNYLRNAQSQKSQIEGGANVDFNNILNNIASQKAALAASMGDINSFSANPIAVNADSWINSVADAGAGLGGLNGGANDPNAGVSIDENPNILAMLRKQYPGLF